MALQSLFAASSVSEGLILENKRDYKNNYSKFDEEKFINDFSLLNWANILNDLDANIKFDGFFINCHAPHRKLLKHEKKFSTKTMDNKRRAC